MSSSVITATNQLKKGLGLGLDQYLTFNANQSHFATQYTKVADHAKYTLSQPFVENIDFGKTVSAELPMYGDFLSAVYIRIRLPELVVPTGSTYVAWTQTIAFAMIESMEIRLGETVIVQQPGNFMEIMDYLQTPYDQSVAHWKTVGRLDTVLVAPTNAVKERDVLIPLNFWFNKKLSQAIPIFALNGDRVKLVMTLRQFQDVVIYDGNILPEQQSIVDAEILSDFYVVTDEERDTRYSSLSNGTRILNPMSYLIEQWQTRDFNIQADMATSKFTLDFTGYVKELVFYVIEEDSEEQNDYFMFGQRDSARQGVELITSVSLLLDGKIRYEKLPESYYRLITPQKYHSYAGNRNIYVMSFSETPETARPSATLDFTAYDKIEMVLDFVPNIPRSRLYVLAVIFNRLTLTETSIQVEYVR